MRHRLKGRKLGMTTAHREAVERNIVTSLFIHGRIATTLQRAKEFRGAAEHLITLGKKGGLANFRHILSVVQDARVAKKIVNDVAKRFADRRAATPASSSSAAAGGTGTAAARSPSTGSATTASAPSGNSSSARIRGGAPAGRSRGIRRDAEEGREGAAGKPAKTTKAKEASAK